MAFVKLDSGILDSTLWMERDCREMFITALLLSEPVEITEPLAQLEVRSLEQTGFVVEPGWYGFVRAAGVGIARRALLENEPGLDALEKLGAPDPESRSTDFEGRRLVRVDGGFIVLNYMKYRDKDHTAAERQRRLRERKANKNNNCEDMSRVTVTPSRATSRIADADADAEEKKKKRFALPDWVPVEPWNGYVDMRKKTRKPMTERAMELALLDLAALKDKGHDPVSVLNESTKKNWMALYAPKDGAATRVHNGANGASANAGWASILSAIHRGKRPEAWPDQATARALDAIGGWSVIKEVREADLPFRQRDFVAAYNAAAGH